MTEAIYSAIAKPISGYLEAPAGCGKTEAIVRTVGDYCNGRQLILTHTNAGVDALLRRFRGRGVARTKFHVDTIAGWAWGWVRAYPRNAGYSGIAEIADWRQVYIAMRRLLNCDYVRNVVLNSYDGVIVDEYQDCTQDMHRLICSIKEILPCRALGDPLQGVFDFQRDDPLVEWSDVKQAFCNDLGVLDVPHRWINANNRRLGEWLLKTRNAFFQCKEPNLQHSPVIRMETSSAKLNAAIIGLVRNKSKTGTVCVIRSKSHKLSASVETTLVKHGLKVIETNELTELKRLLQHLALEDLNQKCEAFCKFLQRSYIGYSEHSDFISKILKGVRQVPKLKERKHLCDRHTESLSPGLMLDLLLYLERWADTQCKLLDSVSALKCILERHLDSGLALMTLYDEELSKRRHRSTGSRLRSAIGSTLLVKGLEFDHSVILRGKNWGTTRDLYVALSRGSRSVTLIDIA